MVTQNVRGNVFVVGVDRKVTSVVVVNNKNFGQGYLTVRDENGREVITETHRCFTDEIAASNAAASRKICRELGIDC